MRDFPRMILITGKAHHGKGTAAQELVTMLKQNGYQPKRHALADPLKHAASALTGYTLREVENLKAQDAWLEEYQVNMGVLLQQLGDFVRSHNEDWLISRAKRSVLISQENPEKEVHIFDDIRLIREMGELQELAQTHLNDSDDPCEQPCLRLRIDRSGVNSTARSGHQTETELEQIPVDFEIINDGHIGELSDKLRDTIIQPWFPKLRSFDED